MEVVVTTGTIRRAKLQSKCHHQQTNTQLFSGWMLNIAQPTVSKALKGNVDITVEVVCVIRSCFVNVAGGSS